MEKAVFKQAFRGFDRNQVLNYIDNMAQELDNREKEYQKSKEDLQQELQDLSNSLSENYEKLINTQNKADSLSNEINYYKQDNYRLKIKVDEYENLLFEKRQEIDNLQDKVNKLMQEKDNLEEKVLNVELVKTEAQSYIDKAKIQAKQIIQHADLQAAQKRQKFREESQELFANAALYKVNIVNMEMQLEEAFAKMKQVISDMEHSAKIMENNFNGYACSHNEISVCDQPKIHSNAKPLHMEKKVLQEKTSQPNIKVITKPSKKTLAENILENLSKLIEK